MAQGYNKENQHRKPFVVGDGLISVIAGDILLYDKTAEQSIDGLLPFLLRNFLGSPRVIRNRLYEALESDRYKDAVKRISLYQGRSLTCGKPRPKWQSF